MEKYKICPLCRKHNPPTVFECIGCEADLTSVMAVSESNEEKIMQNTVTSPKTETKKFRICDCGEKNPPSARKCLKCGEDISDVIPVPDTSSKTRFVFSSADGSYQFEIKDEKFTVGRECHMQEYLSSKMYVSRNHAEITLSEGRLFIRNLSRSNGTYVNNQKIDDEIHELHEGDEVAFGGFVLNGEMQSEAAYFHVRRI